ncbi:MAG TPA: glycosyl hydrolase family 18 protein [Burkholderiales bacterium]|nr:glycosyl hydrolase family 18 protein [Burkholderiales bacterium]
MLNKNTLTKAIAICCLLLTGCGGGGGGGSDSGNGGTTTTTTTNNGGNTNPGGNTSPPYNYFPGQHVAFTQTANKVVAAYLPSYEMDAGYDLNQLPAGNLTHLLYAFLRMCGPGQVAADAAVCASKNNFELAVDGSTPDNAHHTQLLNFKQRAPNVKLLVSIGGGGAGSNPFFYMAGNQAQRTVFINSLISYLTTYTAYDGVDIDWEAPTNDLGLNTPALGAPSDSQAYVDLLQELRAALNQLGASNGRQYQLTSAVITVDYIVNAIDYASAQTHLDYVFAMTYDYYGSWSGVGHHSALFPANNQFGIQHLLAAGVPASKIVQGVAMYSRGWGNCTNPANPMQGTGNSNYNGGDGTEKYTTLAGAYFDSSGNGVNGYQVQYDATLHAYYLWHPGTLTFIGYDDPRAVAEKGQYAVSQNLAGVFAWEIGQDNGDLLSAMNYGVGNQRQ